MRKICENCLWWVDKDYCTMKDLFTSTDAEHECDEKDIDGDVYFMPIIKEEKK